MPRFSQLSRLVWTYFLVHRRLPSAVSPPGAWGWGGSFCFLIRLLSPQSLTTSTVSLLGLLNRHHRLGACKPQTLTVHGPAGWTSEILGSGEMSLKATLLDLSTSPSLCVLTRPSLCGCLCLGLFSQGHQSYWILAPLPDLTLT